MSYKKSKKFVAYYRVSTKKQSAEMKAQKTAVQNYLKDDFPPEQSFTEIESGAKTYRPELHKALDYCHTNKATLVVAKLDRLSRDLEFIGWIQNTDIQFVCCDMPEATRETIGFMGVMARWEREQIAKRTKEALAEKRKAGVPLGSHNPRVARGLAIWRAKIKKQKKKEAKATKKKDKKKKILKKTSPTKRELADQEVLQTFKALKLQGLSYVKIAKALNKLKIKTRRGKQWSAHQAFRVGNRNGL